MRVLQTILLLAAIVVLPAGCGAGGSTTATASADMDARLKAAEQTIRDLEAQVSAAKASTTVTASSTNSTAPTTARAPTTMPARYEAHLSAGLAGWSGSAGWSAVDGVLMNDGTRGDSYDNAPLLAPCTPATTEYAVQVDIQLVAYSDSGAWTGADGFGLVLRRGPEGGLRVGHYASAGMLAFGSAATVDPDGAHYGIYASNAPSGALFTDGVIADAYFRPRLDWHTYRVEARGNQYTVFIDGSQVLEVRDNRYLTPGRVGVWSDHCQISVRSFVVEAL
jgi:hypothetical protein